MVSTSMFLDLGKRERERERERERGGGDYRYMSNTLMLFPKCINIFSYFDNYFVKN